MSQYLVELGGDAGAGERGEFGTRTALRRLHILWCIELGYDVDWGVINDKDNY